MLEDFDYINSTVFYHSSYDTTVSYPSSRQYGGYGFWY